MGFRTSENECLCIFLGSTWNPELLPFQKTSRNAVPQKSYLSFDHKKINCETCCLYIACWILIFLCFTFRIFLPRGFCQMLAGCVADCDVEPQWMWRWQFCNRLRDFLWRVHEAWAVLQMHVHLGRNPLPSRILHEHAFFTKKLSRFTGFPRQGQRGQVRYCGGLCRL